MKGVTPPPVVESNDSVPRLGSRAMVVNTKSARHAVTGFVFVTRMLAYIT